MFSPKEEVERLMLQATEEQIIEFYQMSDVKGDVVWYVESYKTVFDNNEIFKNALEQPFRPALEFLNLLWSSCNNYVIDLIIAEKEKE